MSSDPTKDYVSPWVPMTDPVDQKVTGKFIEELGECIAATARCQIQGLYETEPDTGKPNKQWVEEEIADVEAGIILMKERFHLDREAIEQRVQRKLHNLRKWHRMDEVQ